MKIITDSAVYVQKNDIAYLSSSDLAIPASIFMKILDNGKFIVNDSNRYDFIKFEEESEIEYFKGLDWIIDYNEVKDLSDEEIIELGQGIGKEREEIANTFNSMSKEEKRKSADMITKCYLLDFKFYSLRDILWFKQGHIKMKLPNELDKKSFIKKIFNKNRNKIKESD